MTREGWHLRRYQDFRKVQVRLLALNARLSRRLDGSDLRCRANTEAHLKSMNTK